MTTIIHSLRISNSHKAAATRKEIFYNTKMVFITSDGDQRRQVSNQNVKQLRRVMFASLANNHQQFIRIFKFPLEEVHQSYVPMLYSRR